MEAAVKWRSLALEEKNETGIEVEASIYQLFPKQNKRSPS